MKGLASEREPTAKRDELPNLHRALKLTSDHSYAREDFKIKQAGITIEG